MALCSIRSRVVGLALGTFVLVNVVGCEGGQSSSPPPPPPGGSPPPAAAAAPKDAKGGPISNAAHDSARGGKP